MSIDLKAIRARADTIPRGDLREARSEAVILIRHDVPAMLYLVGALTGALLGSERAAECGGCLECCPVCRMCLIVTVADDGGHADGCPLDAALTLAGFPDFASRDAERARRARP